MRRRRQIPNGKVAKTSRKCLPSQSGAPVTINWTKPIKQLRRLAIASLSMVMLLGWFGTPAIGQDKPVPVWTKTQIPVEKLIPPKPAPNYDAEVLVPLHQEQAAAKSAAERLAVDQARERALEIARESVQPVQPVAGNCMSWITAAGITDVQDAVTLINWESGCNPWIYNRGGSGACGVAQELPCGKSGCVLGDGACQMRWMNTYVLERYGSWANAVAFHRANNWY